VDLRSVGDFSATSPVESSKGVCANVLVRGVLVGLQRKALEARDVPVLEHCQPILDIGEIGRKKQRELSAQSLSDHESHTGVGLGLYRDLGRSERLVFKPQSA